MTPYSILFNADRGEYEILSGKTVINRVCTYSAASEYRDELIDYDQFINEQQACLPFDDVVPHCLDTELDDAMDLT